MLKLVGYDLYRYNISMCCSKSDAMNLLDAVAEDSSISHQDFCDLLDYYKWRNYNGMFVS